ncbi:MAG: hypothetical protein HYV26_07360, partial [Candidatus Hydrogenedentes bacterium]|nr:hypothetical protein [Candidatus Hydrogenedentota bacterium]
MTVALASPLDGAFPGPQGLGTPVMEGESMLMHSTILWVPRVAALMLLALSMLLASLLFAAEASGESPVDYSIIYIRMPRYGDEVHLVWPEVFHPARIQPGCLLILLYPDGRDEVLLDPGDGAVTDPFVSFDGEWVYYALFHDVRPEVLNYQRGYLSEAGADIFRIHIPTRRIEQLTFGEFTPNTGAGRWDESNPVDPPEGYNRLGYGIVNMAPCPLAGGQVAFVSNRNGFMPTKSFTNPCLQLFVMDEDGRNVTPIAPMTIGSALHPTPLVDGRIAFSSYESQGLRDERNWGIWAIWPDGRHWEPLVSSFKQAGAFHFMTQLSGGDLVVEDYYNLNNFGFGALYRFPLDPPVGESRFHSAFPDENPAIDQTVGQGFHYPFQMGFSPRGIHSITPFTHGGDEAAPQGAGGGRVGKFTHPSAGRNNDVLVSWSPGPVNALERPGTLPAVDAGIYLIPGGRVLNGLADLVYIKNDDEYNEIWPRALLPYRDLYGQDEPYEFPWLPNDGSVHPELPAGTPYGLVGTSSFYKRESFPGYVTQWSDTFDGLDAFNTPENDQSSNWFTQGADAGRYDDEEIWAVRLLAMEPNTHRSYGPHEGQHFYNFANEKLRILGEIPLRKWDNGEPVLDPEGNPD